MIPDRPGAAPLALLERLNRSHESGFIDEVGRLYEHSPWIAAQAWHHRPFLDRAALHDVMQTIVRQASGAQQLALIRAHPDLAGRLARGGGLESHSASEQSGLGLDRLSDAEYDRFDRLNTAYQAKFGIPFIIAVRAQTRAGVMRAFEARLCHDPETEIAAALDEIGKIARFRLDDLT